MSPRMRPDEKAAAMTERRRDAFLDRVDDAAVAVRPGAAAWMGVCVLSLVVAIALAFRWGGVEASLRAAFDL